MEHAKCRSCGAPMIWAVMASTKRRMPLDAEPHPEGTIALQPDGTAGWLKGDVLAEARAAGAKLYRSHFASCPNSHMHRKPKGAA
jgi:hypothetical protein